MGDLSQKLTDLLVIIVPLVFFVSLFFYLESRRKK